jgi:hypothetical protein
MPLLLQKRDRVYFHKTYYDIHTIKATFVVPKCSKSLPETLDLDNFNEKVPLP